MTPYPESPLTIGNWVRLALLGHRTVYGQIIGLEPVITLGQPALPETDTDEAVPARTLAFGYGALFESYDATEAECRRWLQGRAPEKPQPPLPDCETPYPQDWDPEKLAAFAALTSEQRALAMERHHDYPGADQYQCAEWGKDIDARMKGGMTKEAAMKAEDEIPF